MISYLEFKLSQVPKSGPGAPSAGKGEYGLLAPGNANSSNKESSGKIYTVSVAE
jgi:hypothetical protein